MIVRACTSYLQFSGRRVVYTQRKTLFCYADCRNLLRISPLILQQNAQKKGQSKPHKSKSKSKTVSTDFEASVRDFSPALHLDRVLKSCQDEFAQFSNDVSEHMSVRRSARQFEQLRVPFKGRDHLLQHIARITMRQSGAGASLVTIDLTPTPLAIADVNKALLESGMEVSPQQQGNVLLIQLPSVTREHRERKVKAGDRMATAFAERLSARCYAPFIKSLGSPPLSEHSDFEELKAARDFALQMKNHYVERAKKVVKEKQEELMREVA